MVVLAAAGAVVRAVVLEVAVAALVVGVLLEVVVAALVVHVCAAVELEKVAAAVWVVVEMAEVVVTPVTELVAVTNSYTGWIIRTKGTIIYRNREDQRALLRRQEYQESQEWSFGQFLG